MNRRQLRFGFLGAAMVAATVSIFLLVFLRWSSTDSAPSDVGPFGSEEFPSGAGEFSVTAGLADIEQRIGALAGRLDTVNSIDKRLARVERRLDSIVEQASALSLQQSDVPDVRSGSIGSGLVFGSDFTPGVISPEELARQVSEEALSQEDQFLAEPIDPVWSSATTSYIGEVLSSDSLLEVADSRVLDFSCRQTRCRIRVDHPTQDDMGPFALEFAYLLRHRVTSLAQFDTRQSDGSIISEFYLMR